MTKIIIIILFTGFFTINLNAQKIVKHKSTNQFDTYHKNIYFELLGSNILYGVNFDMRLTKGIMDGSGFRVGVGGLGVSGNVDNTDVSLTLITFPLEYNYLMGPENSSLQLGVGLLPIYASITGHGELTDYEYVRGDGFGLAGGFVSVGYRYQPSDSGFMMQVNWNPLILRDGGFAPLWLGLGIGFGFK